MLTSHLYSHNIPFLFCLETIEYNVFGTRVKKNIVRIFISRYIYNNVYKPFCSPQCYKQRNTKYYSIIYKQTNLPCNLFYYIILNDFVKGYQHFLRNVMQNGSPKIVMYIVKNQKIYQCKLYNRRVMVTCFKNTPFY